MNCKNCNKNIENDSKFCQFCGEKTEKSENTKIEYLDKDFIGHLEFLGYEVENPEEQDASQRYIARHKNRSNLIFNPVKDTGITFVSVYTLNENKVEKNRETMLETINSLNYQALFCNFSLSSENTLICAALYIGKYSKKGFADFLELYEADIQARLKDEKLLKFT